MPGTLGEHLADPERFRSLVAAGGADGLVRAIEAGWRAPASRTERILVAVGLARPRLGAQVVLAYALGAAYAGPGPSASRVALAVASVFLISCAGALFNACSDLGEDIRNDPGRAYVVAQLGYGPAMALGVACGALGVLAGMLSVDYVLALLLVAAIGAHQYSFPPLRAKGRGFVGMVANAQAGTWPFLMGWLTHPADPELSARIVIMFLFLLTFRLARGIAKDLPDFYGDLAAGTSTSATYFGSVQRAGNAAIVIVVGACASLLVPVALGHERPRVLFALVWLAPMLRNLWQLRSFVDPRRGNELHTVGTRYWHAFLGTLVVLVEPTTRSLVLVGLGVGLIVGSETFRLDSRLQKATR